MRISLNKIGALAPYIFYVVLSLVVLGPLLRSGYILTLDMTFPPHFNFTNQLYGLDENLWTVSGAPFKIIEQAVTLFLPGWVLQKIILFFSLFLSGLGMHKLVSAKGISNYFAGLLYVINPFTYTRFLAGHWGILWIYALLPFTIKAFIEMLGNGGVKSAIKVAILITLTGLSQIHGIFLTLLAFLIIFIVAMIKKRRQTANLWRATKLTGLSALLFCALNFYWILPILTSSNTVIEQIGLMDLTFFAPRATSTAGVAFDTAAMYGFWRSGYIYAKDFIPLWWLLYVFILYLVLYGFINNFRGKNGHSSEIAAGNHAEQQENTIVPTMAVALSIMCVVSLLLAVGLVSSITHPVFAWLYEHIIFLRGFRDSQKFVALICLCYAYLGGLGVYEFVKGYKKLKRVLLKIAVVTIIVAAMLTPVAYSFTMFGFFGQLGVTDYPQEWYEVNKYLNNDTADFNVLFLPWHMVMDFRWLPNRDIRLGNPAKIFFDKPIIAGDNIEIPGLYSQSTNPISKYIEFLLKNGKDVNNLGELLAPLNVKYIILDHEVDYEAYNYLRQQKDITLEFERPGLTLFRNTHPVAKIYGVESQVYIKDWDEYLRLSQIQDVTRHLYIIGDGKTGSDNEETYNNNSINFTRNSMVKYTIAGNSHKYVIFTVPQDVNTESWEYNGQPSVQNLGLMPAFKSDAGAGQIVYERFRRVYLPSYVVSVITLTLMLWLHFRRPRLT